MERHLPPCNLWFVVRLLMLQLSCVTLWYGVQSELQSRSIKLQHTAPIDHILRVLWTNHDRSEARQIGYWISSVLLPPVVQGMLCVSCVWVTRYFSLPECAAYLADYYALHHIDWAACVPPPPTSWRVASSDGQCVHASDTTNLPRLHFDKLPSEQQIDAMLTRAGYSYEKAQCG
jgi:hypothetical protein